ncbi:SIMPL domain-containing protein [Singulisphaera sp. Ch08]|uniref:SIMPL domain-containing protein n=1 Tax=Singulisphaera sp. Ch08 TaxID=3120278 RepID=A0AAU7CD09_9BACT
MMRLSFTCLVALSALAVYSSPSVAEERVEKPTISVSGTGKLSAVPDIAEIQVGVRSQAPTAQAALAANSDAMNAMHAILKQSGVETKDIQTTQIQVSPEYSQPPNRPRTVNEAEFIPRIVGYRVDNTVQITARQIPKLGALLDALVMAGANQIHGISFRIDNPEKRLDEVRRSAMADAKSKATLLAEEAGVALGAPIKIIDEQGGPRPPTPLYAPRMEMMARAVAPTPIAAGEQELSVTVHVVYEIKPGK